MNLMSLAKRRVMMDRRNSPNLRRRNLHGAHTSHYHTLEATPLGQIHLNIVCVVW